MFRGSIPAVITPFDTKGGVNFDDLENHINF